MRALSFLPWLALSLIACIDVPKVGTQSNPRNRKGLPDFGDPLVSNVEITISNLTKSDAELFRGHIYQGDVRNVVLKSFDGGTAVYDIEYHGCECDLAGVISQIPSPGLKYQGRVTKLKYSAFDNRPPEILFVHPEREEARLISDAEQLVILQVTDTAVSEVTVNGIPAEAYRPDIFLVRIRLMEGANQVVAWARDRAGNESTARMRVVAAGTPTAESAVWKNIDGKSVPGAAVLVERREVPVDAKGRYKAVIPIPKGQNQIEIIEIRPDGSKAVSVRGLL
jgi:hypothetical protein